MSRMSARMSRGCYDEAAIQLSHIMGQQGLTRMYDFPTVYFCDAVRWVGLSAASASLSVCVRSLKVKRLELSTSKSMAM